MSCSDVTLDHTCQIVNCLAEARAAADDEAYACAVTPRQFSVYTSHHKTPSQLTSLHEFFCARVVTWWSTLITRYALDLRQVISIVRNTINFVHRQIHPVETITSPRWLLRKVPQKNRTLHRYHFANGIETAQRGQVRVYRIFPIFHSLSFRIHFLARTTPSEDL